MHTYFLLLYFRLWLSHCGVCRGGWAGSGEDASRVRQDGQGEGSRDRNADAQSEHDVCPVRNAVPCQWVQSHRLLLSLQWRTQRRARGSSTPHWIFGILLNTCLQKNAVQALLLYSLNTKLCIQENVKNCTLISHFCFSFWETSSRDPLARTLFRIVFDPPLWTPPL